MRHGRTKKLTIEPGLNKEVGGLLLWNRGSETAHLELELAPEIRVRDRGSAPLADKLDDARRKSVE